MNSKNQEPRAFNPSFDGLGVKDLLHPEIEFGKKVLKASELVLDKSVELVDIVFKNTDRIAGAAITAVSAVTGVIGSFATVIAGIEPAVAKNIFGSASHAEKVIALAGITASSMYTLVVGRNITMRRDIHDPKGMQ